MPDEVSYLQLAAGAKHGWGGPVTLHSAYECFFTTENDDELNGSNGTYTLTTEAPPVRAFWSATVYDTGRGGHFHENDANRYHFNNTTATPNDNGTFTFTFKTKCEVGDINCLEVPDDSPFDLTIRYYLPEYPIRNGKWRMKRPKLEA